MVFQYYSQLRIAVKEQIRFLKSKGLSFENECRVKYLLKNISMFHLKSTQRIYSTIVVQMR